MKVSYEGRDWDLDSSELDLTQAFAITLHTGLTLAEWEKTLAEGASDPEFLKAYQCLFWLMLSQNGETCPIGDVNFKIIKFLEAFTVASEAEVAAEEAAKAEAAGADPTQPAPASEPSPESAPIPTPPQPEPVESRDG